MSSINDTQTYKSHKKNSKLSKVSKSYNNSEKSESSNKSNSSDNNSEKSVENTDSESNSHKIHKKKTMKKHAKKKKKHIKNKKSEKSDSNSESSSDTTINKKYTMTMIKMIAQMCVSSTREIVLVGTNIIKYLFIFLTYIFNFIENDDKSSYSKNSGHIKLRKKNKIKKMYKINDTISSLSVNTTSDSRETDSESVSTPKVQPHKHKQHNNCIHAYGPILAGS